MAKWSREEIIRRIVDRETSGLPLTPGGEQGIDPTLYQAGTRIFGSWKSALKSAGVPPKRAPHRRWLPATILAEIRVLARKARFLGRTERKNMSGSLRRAARRYFGSWSNAVAASGVDPKKLRQTPRWTRERILEAILIRALRCEPLNSQSVEPRSLTEAGTRFFGSWNLALTAAGLDHTQFACHRIANGMSPTCEARTTHSENRFCPRKNGAILKKDDATLDLLKVRKPRWTGENVVRAILVRFTERRPLKAMDVCRDDASFYRAALRYFGKWRFALLAAGLKQSESGDVSALNPTVSEVSGLETNLAEASPFA